MQKTFFAFELESEEKIGHLIYEELDIDIRSSISSNTLKELELKKLITKEVSRELNILRDQTIFLIEKRIEPKEIPSNRYWLEISSKFKKIYAAISD